MKLDRMLCPVDSSKPSAAALRMAGMLAKTLDSELTVLHAQRWEFPPYFTVAQTRKLQAQLRRSERAARKYFQDFVKRNLPDELPHAYLFVDDEPVAAILRSSLHLHADLIVSVRLGSVMEGVVRQAGTPVVAVGPGARATPKEAIREILCPVSFDSLSRATIEVGAFLAGKVGARITVLHVVEPKSETNDLMNATEKRLCDWVTSTATDRCSTREVVRQGNRVQAIVGEAKRIRSDLLVIGASPRRSLGSIMFGTTTELLIRSAPCPVLVVAEPKAGMKLASIGKASQKELQP